MASRRRRTTTPLPSQEPVEMTHEEMLEVAEEREEEAVVTEQEGPEILESPLEPEPKPSPVQEFVHISPAEKIKASHKQKPQRYILRNEDRRRKS